MVRWNVIFIYQQLPIHLKTGGMGKTIRIQYSVFSYSVFFLNPYMDEGVENPEERDWLFCNAFFIIILYIFIYIDI